MPSLLETWTPQQQTRVDRMSQERLEFDGCCNVAPVRSHSLGLVVLHCHCRIGAAVTRSNQGDYSDSV